MKKYEILILAVILFSCNQQNTTKTNEDHRSVDSLELIEMIDIRENAMINKDIDMAMSQFSRDITWINSQGYLFEGKTEVFRFHDYLVDNDSLDYYYEAGTPRVRITDANNAIVYYSWKMYWYQKYGQKDTTNKEIGLMTLTAKKFENGWKWIAVTNQHTPWFYDEIEPVTID